MIKSELDIENELKEQNIYSRGNKHVATLRCLYDKTYTFGTICGIHGHAGWWNDVSLRVFADLAPEFGFNFYVIDGRELAIDRVSRKSPTDVKFRGHKLALGRSVQAIKALYKSRGKNFRDGYNIAVGHSMGCRAWSDLGLESSTIRGLFAEYTFVNPYVLTSRRILDLIERSPDPSSFLNRSGNKPKSRKIDNVEFSYKINSANFNIPLIGNTDARDIPAVANLVSGYLNNKNQNDIILNFILGTADKEADWKQNKELFEKLPFTENKNKFIHEVAGGNHHMDNVVDLYRPVVKQVLGAAQRRAIARKR